MVALQLPYRDSRLPSTNQAVSGAHGARNWETRILGGVRACIPMSALGHEVTSAGRPFEKVLVEDIREIATLSMLHAVQDCRTSRFAAA
jgi:hypothetical protein